MTMVRAARAARGVMAAIRLATYSAGAMTDFAAVVVGDPEREEESDSEEQDVHNRKRKARLEHGTVLIQMQRPRKPRLHTARAKNAQAEVKTVCRSLTKVGTVIVGN